MKSARRRAEAVLAVLVAGAAVVLVVGAGVLYFGSIVDPVHTNPAAIPSAAADVDAGRYVAAVDEARRLARALLVEENLPGLSVAVAVDGAIVWTEGFGYAAVDRTPVTPLTRFRLGALSKPMTAVAAALLHDRGRLDLDAPVQRYVPAYPHKQWTVTTRQLMGDVAGVHRSRGDNIDGDSMPTQHCANLDEAVELFAGDQLRFEPGTEHRYSIYGWVLVSAVVERAGGEPFTRFMERQVFAPLGMDRTVVAEREGLDDATSYTPRSILRTRLGIEEPAPPDYSCLAGAGAVLSTPTDLVRLGSAVLKPGLLKAETITSLQTPTRLVSGASTTYALGWTVGSVQLAGGAARMVSHRGSPRGGTVSLLTFPDLGLTVAAAANMTNVTGVNPLALQVADAFARHQHRRDESGK
jgi:serine beta-lactamase-like protein LACTB, mitochondrial